MNQSNDSAPTASADPVPGPLSPTRLRLLGALALAIGGFLLPQEVPLVWYPLNEPGNDILYLEIDCAADGDGQVEILQNLTHGFNDLDKISFPISATEQAFTYTFPLSDAPMVELRLNSPVNGVSLFLEKMRIIDRRGIEVRRFTADMFSPVEGVAAITPEPDGWRITSTPDATITQCRIELFAPILAQDITARNIVRCYLSTGYLAGMLWIILLAVLFTFWRPTGWRDFLAHVGFMAALASMFAFVGNRGLIKNSWHYAQYQYPTLPDEMRLELDLAANASSGIQLFWDTGTGYRQEDSDWQTIADHRGLQTIRFPLPLEGLKALRLDPRENPGNLSIRGIRVVDWGNRTHAVLNLEDVLHPAREIERLTIQDDRLLLETTPDARDPIANFTPAALDRINEAIEHRQARFVY